ncbi:MULTISPECIES: mannose-1-phosphate guanylyltransferase/mannose-6-phosphate isomerase [Delftia]|uniref:mannose-1-phosphate guanylyltransferase/mannose-6-phosphate isomerase n=1 Tax=Delftia TaxID=80865 RepID=UPI0017811857|nr:MULTISPECIES: mannose-1-phosphate guanylyltransferase/mannose-6-phosphate isomerase [Delftia]MBD9584313.1 mannose-1-phosphate guanylyltransferase/mannose-6-phosphate isomerase [Delftia sp. DLF01]MCX7504747.1 mannose-1-phosphate guanylyltransferase/mannose-6-phosphate isomerase [Delftia tsuruhatensis]
MNSPLLPVILCGGSGTRLWPLSRETYPKQFLALADSQTMLQQTATRLHGLTAQVPQALAPLLVCNVEHRFLAASQLMHVGIRDAAILLEPAGRNTAPALTLAALHACADGADPILLAMPADHVVADRQAFHGAVHKAYVQACQGSMATFGIVADRPETGYGYIQFSESGEPGVHRVESFAEKPDVERARHYLEAGNYLWNSGLFMVRASVWIKAMEHCRPDILDACRSAMQSAQRDLDFIRPGAAAFAACPSDSIDYAVMERLPAMPQLGIPAQVVPLQAGWSDVGAWDALWDVRDQDDEGNALMGDAVQHGCANSLLLSSSRLVAGVGLQDVVVVETPDAVLVVDKSRTQDVKKIVSHLAQSGHALAHSHRKVHRPWGWYDSIDNGERFQVKRIVVNPGASLSLQMHHHRAEHWVVVKGTAEVTNGEKTFLLGENESTFIPLGHVHRLANPGKVPLEIIEVQSGSYLGEDDIVRFEDTYGRVQRLA